MAWLLCRLSCSRSSSTLISKVELFAFHCVYFSTVYLLVILPTNSYKNCACTIYFMALCHSKANRFKLNVIIEFYFVNLLHLFLYVLTGRQWRAICVQRRRTMGSARRCKLGPPILQDRLLYRVRSS